MDPSNYPLCRHTKTNGRRCQSPALATSAFCYHHQKARRTRPATISAGPGLSTRVLHSLESRESIQRALSLVYSGIRHDLISYSQAKKLLSVIRTASANLPKPL